MLLLTIIIYKHFHRIRQTVRDSTASDPVHYVRTRLYWRRKDGEREDPRFSFADVPSHPRPGASDIIYIMLYFKSPS